jgi:hypothetical protein
MYDPDFIITISGNNVTRYVHNWKLTDTEGKEGGSASSTLEVVMKNPDQILSSKFNGGQEINLIYGYYGNLGETVYMTIKKVEESYSVDEQHDYIKVIGFDALDDLMSGTLKGGGQEPVNAPPSKVTK